MSFGTTFASNFRIFRFRFYRNTMKQTFTILSFIFATSMAFGQDVEIHENGAVIPGSAITIDSAVTADHTIADYYIVNTGSASVEIDWDRVRRAHMSPIHDQICDDVYCYDATNTTIYSSPTSKTIAAGDSMIFQPKVYADGEMACAIYTYIIYSNHGSVYEDSVQVKYRFGGQDCFLDMPETPVTYSVYPNPAATQLNINVTTNGHVMMINVYNIMGEVVLRASLSDGLNQLSVSELNNGVYFYSVLKDGAVIETKKLIVRH